ncbi:uncharacterized protein B0P05DRAFT_557418 [Gilbertella persicaria]|uniref:MIT domain-containing protein n=1 Tax=Rhizopus stolonifer TaxID=4846 RepID=A0A367KWY4_RHIST|nr:uncharacterized protein B0P05DRAFT_557418 [Gilbertella persicaria]KAI8061540.1 hypothetical protein B0P05DRAFT_557418 [Gilbertella persicaria]RCI06728.1 hypothetical protein CU098_006807 [Rhizopus stolonifer]
MPSFVSSIFHNSASKIESTLLGKNSRLAMHAPNNCYYSTDNIPAPPPYDTMPSPTPTPSNSWTSEMSALAEKIRDDVTSTFKGNHKSNSQQVDRHSISQGMKLVSIAADEYESGNESVALDLYLTGVDKILMALPNKTDLNTKTAIREKLQSVEERVGILNLAASQKKLRQEDTDIKSSTVNSYILSRIASTISTISNKAYQSAKIEEEDCSASSNITTHMEGDSMTRFKRFGQYMIDAAVTCAILIKQSPLPGLLSFLFGYVIQLFLWIDSQYHIIQKLQDMSVQLIKLSLQADEQYRLHEYISEGLYIVFAAGLKAVVAFKETPRKNEASDGYPSRKKERVMACAPPAPQKTSTSWTPW